MTGVTVSAYHNQTKHSLQRYARGPETIDWNDQPDGFRQFVGAERIDLPKPGAQSPVSWEQLLQVGALPMQPVTLENLGLMLELAFGITAWKEYGPDRWALRSNPSSGNLHPSEVYVSTTRRDLLEPGVYHYSSYHHGLQRRCRFTGMSDVAQDEWLIGLGSVHWREAWKYGERAYRYCQLDAGHAYAALCYAAALQGWQVELLAEYGDAELAAMLGMDRQQDFVDREGESPDWLCRIVDSAPQAPHSITASLDAVRSGTWSGKAQSLGAFHMYHWPLIEQAVAAAAKTRSARTMACTVDNQRVTGKLWPSNSQLSAVQIIRQRRSAQRFQAASPAISEAVFFRLLSSLLDHSGPALRNWPWSPAVHVCLFVHKVENLMPGLYLLPRSGGRVDRLRNMMNPDFQWEPVEAFPGLYRLHVGDMRGLAKTLSCHQSIASDSAFSLAMLSEFDEAIAENAWNYRRLFWECGLLGQILYLEAETQGLRGTGIGCFFDDEIHEVLGIKNSSLQSLYHFTVGLPLLDNRISTLPAYAHLATRGDR